MILDTYASDLPGWRLHLNELGYPIVGPIVFSDETSAMAAGSNSDHQVFLGDEVTAEKLSKGAEFLETRHVSESAASFDVSYYTFGGYQGLRHEGEGNWIFWNDDLTTFIVSGARDATRRWIHVRFLLRHLYVAGMIARPGYQCAHAVVAPLLSKHGNSAVMLVGPSGSGKSHLYRDLSASNFLGEWVEDDCAVLDPQCNAIYLIPQEKVARRAQHIPVVAAILLDETAKVAAEISEEDGKAFMESTPTPWPANWLPGATARISGSGGSSVGGSGVQRFWRVPARSTPHAIEALAAITDLIAT